MAEVRLFGVRHHGPGSARSLASALASLAPDCLLVEGPPEADALIPLVAAPGMQPPVALLVYDSEAPDRGGFYPYADFSPEWVALRYAVRAGIAARFIDLPLLQRDQVPDGRPPRLRDPLSELAEAAGHGDGESWWDELVESRGSGGAAVFDAVAEAMAALREGEDGQEGDEERREAHMRRAIREAAKQGFARIAVVCGAWHVPALARHDERGMAARDAATLKGLARVKTGVAWAPWSYAHLAADSGYRAGVVSPEWYELVWRHEPAALAPRWLARAAQLLRGEDLEASPASVIEALRLAEALAALRGRASPTLADLEEAALGALCFADPVPLALIRRKLVVGERLGTIPDEAPVTPLQSDLQRQARRLRLPLEAASRRLDLDLRGDTDLQRSRLLHRLALLGIGWGQRQDTRGARGSFREEWVLEWKPEFAVTLVAAARLGATVESAAVASAAGRAAAADSVTRLAGLIGRILDADLPAAAATVVSLLAERGALANDVFDLMGALPPLASLARYGSVRGETAAVPALIAGLVPRIAAGLVAACQSLDDEAAGKVRSHLTETQQALRLLENPALAQPWDEALAGLASQQALHGLVAGGANRLLFDAGRLDAADLGERLGLALSRAAAPGEAAAWVEGLLADGGALLIHDRGLREVLDRWLRGLTPEHFAEVLPLLRRTFAAFAPAERRLLGQTLRRPDRVSAAGTTAFDHERAAHVIPVLRTILGGAA